LVLELRKGARIQIGRLRRVRFPPGFYFYVGSALGPGGIRARVARHLSLSKKPHWHIDFLRPHATIVEVWFSPGRRRREHDWARRLAHMKGSSIRVARFGASDCDCPSHLIRFDRRLSYRRFERLVRELDSTHPRLRHERYASNGSRNCVKTGLQALQRRFPAAEAFKNRRAAMRTSPLPQRTGMVSEAPRPFKTIWSEP
jgi:Uri superfamily endonuclease